MTAPPWPGARPGRPSNGRRRAPGRLARDRLQVQVEEAHHVVLDHLADLIRRHALEIPGDDAHRIRPFRLLVREIRRPDDVLDADLVPQLDSQPVVLEAPVAALSDVIAGQLLGWLPPLEEPLRPQP